MSWIQWIETKRLVTAAPDEMVSAAIARMVDHKVGAVVVVDGGELVGIFTERDVLRRVLGQGRSASTTTVGEVATRDPKVVAEDSSIETCARLVRDYQFRHVPVVDGEGRPVGMISSRDFLRFIVGELEGLIAKAYHDTRIEHLTDPYSMIAMGSFD